MLDLHCHILPGIDDGAVDLDMALQMARIAAADGITTIACTPHIYPGVYDNSATTIRGAIAAFQAELDQRGIALRLLEAPTSTSIQTWSRESATAASLRLRVRATCCSNHRITSPRRDSRTSFSR
jgi:protein-tyrosine phosphatase